MKVTFWKTINPHRGALLVGHVVVVGLLVSGFLQPSAVEQLRQTPPKPVPLPPLTRPAPRSAPALDLIQSKALFHSSRTFYVPPPAPTAPVELKPPPPAYRVATVLMSSGQPSVALLTDAQGKGVLKVRAGDVLAGWTVESVAPRRVRLVFHEEHIELGPKLLSAGANSPNTAGSVSTGTGGGGSASPGTAHTTLLSAGPSSSGGLRVLGGSGVAAGAGRPSVAPRVYEPPPR